MCEFELGSSIIRTYCIPFSGMYLFVISIGSISKGLIANSRTIDAPFWHGFILICWFNVQHAMLQGVFITNSMCGTFKGQGCEAFGILLYLDGNGGKRPNFYKCGLGIYFYVHWCHNVSAFYWICERIFNAECLSVSKFIIC